MRINFARYWTFGEVWNRKATVWIKRHFCYCIVFQDRCKLYSQTNRNKGIMRNTEWMKNIDVEVFCLQFSNDHTIFQKKSLNWKLARCCLNMFLHKKKKTISKTKTWFLSSENEDMEIRSIWYTVMQMYRKYFERVEQRSDAEQLVLEMVFLRFCKEECHILSGWCININNSLCMCC